MTISEYLILTRQDLAAYRRTKGIVSFLIAIFTIDGFCLIATHRLACLLHASSGGLSILGRILWIANCRRFGCYISPKSKIAGGVVFPHPTAVVIGDGVVVGLNAKIFQSVTIGASRGKMEYPTIGSDFTAYPGAVLVGAITLGDHVVVGANSFVNRDIESGMTVIGSPARPLNIKTAPASL